MSPEDQAVIDRLKHGATLAKTNNKDEPIHKGRPRPWQVGKTHTATQPWLAAGVSRRTWYRRRRKA